MPVKWKLFTILVMLIGIGLFTVITYKAVVNKLPYLLLINLAEVVLALTIIDIYVPNINIFSKATTKLNDSKKIVLSFDDGPDPKVTPKLLDLLKKYNIKANFFVLGKKAEEFPNIIKRIVEEGHELCSHGYSHNKVHFMRRDKFIKEIEDTEKIIESLVGRKPKYYRAPHGFIRYDLYRILKAKGYKLIAWSIGVWDTEKDITPQKIIERIKDKIKGGDIILLHDGDESNLRPQYAMLESLPEIINMIQQKGFFFVKISEIVNEIN